VAVPTGRRDLAGRTNETGFRRRLDVLRADHARKTRLIERLRDAGR